MPGSLAKPSKFRDYQSGSGWAISDFAAEAKFDQSIYSNVACWGLLLIWLWWNHSAQSGCSLPGLRKDRCTTLVSRGVVSQGPSSGVRNLRRDSGLPGCAAGVPFRHISPRAGPLPSCPLRIQASRWGTSQTRTRDPGEVQTAEAINVERAPPGAGARGSWSVQPGLGDGHRSQEEGAAGLGGRRRGQVSRFRASRVVPFHVS